METAKSIFGTLAANPDIFTAHATAYANNAVDNSYVIDEILGPKTLDIINSELEVPVIYTAKKPANGGDHPAAAALRHVARQMYDRALAPFSSSSFLHVGATFREIEKYKAHGNHHFAVHGEEAKDEGRNALLVNALKGAIYEAHTKAQMLSGFSDRETAMQQAVAGARSRLAEWQTKMGETLMSGRLLSENDYTIEKNLKTALDTSRLQVKKFNKSNKKKTGSSFSLKTLLGPNTSAKKFLDRVRSFEICDFDDMTTFTTVFDDVMGLNGRIFSTKAFSTGHPLGKSKMGGFDVLSFEDVGYDFSETEWLEYFYQTGAHTGFVIGLFPLELVFKNLSPSRAYTFERCVGGKCVLRFPEGFSNTYRHNERNWSLLVTRPIIRGGATYGFDLQIEVKSRVGPYAVIEIHRIRKGLTQSMVVEAPTRRRMVSILRPSTLSYVAEDGSRVVDFTKAKRFEFPEDQLDQLLSFFSTLDIKSQTLTNMINYTRRAFEGISLVKGVEAKHWLQFDQDLIPDLASAVMMHVVTTLEDQRTVMESFGNGSSLLKSQKFAAPEWLRTLFGPFSLALEHLFTKIPGERLLDFLIKRRSYVRDLSVLSVPVLYETIDWSKKPNDPRTLYFDLDMFGESASPCPVCKSLNGKLGKQKVSCAFKVDSKYDIGFSEDECLGLKVDFLKSASEQPGALCDAISEAAKALLIADHQHICRFEYIRGGPGVGKSYLIRALYPGMAVSTIAVPLLELLADYPRAEVKTTHKFVKAGSKKILFVDEFSIFDGRVLRYMIARYKVDLVYIVGDTEQNKILPEHGEYIGKFLDMESLSRHSLHQNFRTDSKYIVSRLNKVGDYSMHTSSSIPRLPIIHPISDIGEDTPGVRGEIMTIRFSDNAETEYCPGAKSVASIQGKTCDFSRLILSKFDRALSTATGSFIVSISRQKEDLHIYADLEATADWEFWNMLGYVKKETLSEDGQKVNIEMVPTAEALAYMDAPQDLPTNVDLSKDLTRIRGVWSSLMLTDVVDRLRNDFLKEQFHTIRSLVKDKDDFSLVDYLISFDESADLDTIFDGLKQHGLVLRKDISETTVAYYDPSVQVWSSPLSDVAREHADIIYEDSSDVYGVVVKKCFLRALRDGECRKTTLVDAYKLCLANPEGISAEKARDFALAHVEDRIAVWETILGLTSPLVNTPHCTLALELENGHWMKKRSRAVVLVGGCEKHLRSDYTIIDVALEAACRLPVSLIDELLPAAGSALSCLIDALSSKPRTPEGKKLKTSVSVDILRETATLQSRREKLLSYSDESRRPTIVKCGMEKFRLESASGQGITIDILESAPLKEFPLEAELLRCHLPLPSVYDRPLFVEHNLTIPNPSYENLGQVPHDSYLNGPEHLPVTYTVKAHSTLNERAASFFSELGATNGKVSPRIFQPLTKKNRITASAPAKYAVGIGEGLHYDAKNTAQTLSTMVKRYLQPSRALRSVAGSLLAKKIARNAASLVLIPGRVLPKDMQEAVFRKHCSDAHKRNYAGRALAEGEHNKRRINFTMKDIFKPAKGEVKVDKVGQGISASSAYLNFAFGGGFRVLTACWQYALRSNVVLDNGFTEHEFAEMVSEELDKLPGHPDTCVLDVEAMDSTQNWFTQEIEKEFWKLLGIDESFVDEYFTFRNDYPIFYADIIKATVSSAKGSGLPDTLSGNSLIIMVMALWGVKRTGIFFMIVKGDDCALWGYNLAYNEDNMMMIRKYSPFKFSIDINVPMEFCGNAIEGRFICPDLYRTLRKITGNRFRDYQHWCEYQKSLRTRVSLIWSLGITKVVQINAARCGVSEMRMFDVLYAIVSYSHIDEQQWRDHFVKVKYPDPYLLC